MFLQTFPRHLTVVFLLLFSVCLFIAVHVCIVFLLGTGGAFLADSFLRPAHSGRWVAAPPVPGALVVNLGDLAERWTNDAYKSTWHRVSGTG